ncbi:MAG: mannose-1-phosphate guanylyltransferase [Bacteroidetes bacterium]|nr:mannose-1-phosphate guanylyltransferase [Bacteroidota bacterium]
MENLNNNYCVIMAGGIGSRFWPMSTPENPKQFLDVLGIGKSLLQMTYDRLLNICPKENVYILTNEDYAGIVAKQLPDLKSDQILCEPMRKNTAPCIAYAAAKIYEMNPLARMVVAPSDHLIMQEDRFKANLMVALEQAEQNRIATLGIAPTRPDTGYGYIEFNASANVMPGESTPVLQFREKPNLSTAQEFLNAGNFYWNSGIFVWKAEQILDALKAFQPKLHELFCKDLSKYNTAEEQDFVNSAFVACEDISIDFAVMEHAKNVDVVLATFDWSDLGTWGSLYSHFEADSNGNAVVGNAVKMVDSENCLVHFPNHKNALIQGVKNAIIVESNNTLMIINMEDEQKIKEYMKMFS